LITISDSRDMFIQGCFPMKGNSAFLRMDGKNEGVVLKNNYIQRIGKILDERSEDRNKPIIE